MDTRTNHAVYTSNAIIMYHDKEWKEYAVPSATPSLSQLCELVDTTVITHLWVWHDVAIVADEDYVRPARAEWDVLPFYTVDDSIAALVDMPRELVSVTAYRLPKGGRKQVSIGFVKNSQWSFMDEELTPRTLIVTLSYLERALDVVVGTGPTTVGMKLLQQENKLHPEWVKLPDGIDLSPFKDAANEIIWERPLTKDEQGRRKYLLKLDKNSAYLRACVASQYGSGMPVHQQGTQFDAKAIGVWNCTITSYPPHNPLLPPPLQKGSGWWAAPTVKLLQDTGHTVDIKEGYVFPEKHYTMKEWANLLWEVRQSFKHDTSWKNAAARENAYYAIKDIATATVGLLDSEKVKGTWKYRPDIRTQAISTHASVMYYNILKALKESGKTPVMVYMDALYYVVDSPDEQIAGLTVDNTKLGMYKREWCLPMSHEVREALLSGLSVNLKLGMLNDIADEQEDEE